MEQRSMTSWQAAEFGKCNEVLKLTNVKIPEPAHGEARIKVILASIGLPDKLAVEGNYPFVPDPPVTPGQEFVGIVDKAGIGFPYPKGTKILGTSEYYGKGQGAVAEYTICSKNTVLPFPIGLKDEQAAAFPGTYHVAYVGLVNRASLQKGEVLLVLGAAGRTGSAALQLGKALGATVIAVVRNDDQKHFCITQGADYVLNSADEDLVEKVLNLTQQNGVNVIYDTVGGAAQRSVIETIAYKGRLILVGFAGGGWPKIDPLHIMFKGYAVMGALNTIRTEGEKQSAIEVLNNMIANSKITPAHAKVFNFDETQMAMSELGHSGGIAVKINDEL